MNRRLATALTAGALTAAAAVMPACHRSPSGPTSLAAGQRPMLLVKVATWNVRSGMGIRGFATTNWSHDTFNCTDRTQPMNAWGIGLPQAELEKIRSDPAVVAFAVQEAWHCATPANVNSVLGFKTASRDQEGTALLAKYGFAGPVQYQQLNRGAYLVGGDVCLDPACAATMPMYSAHWDGPVADTSASQAEQTLAFLAARGGPHLFMGDLNVLRIDEWNPAVPCTAADGPTRLQAIAMIEAAGYTDAWKATQRGEGWTGMASRPGCGSPAGNLFKRIDYVYTKGVQVLATARFGRMAPGADSPSDHVGLIAQLAVPAGAP